MSGSLSKLELRHPSTLPEFRITSGKEVLQVLRCLLDSYSTVTLLWEVAGDSGELAAVVARTNDDIHSMYSLHTRVKD